VGVRLYLLRLRAASPAILTHEVGSAGFVYSTQTDYIPGSTVRGAILTAAVNNEAIEVKKAEELALNPDYTVSGALLNDSKHVEPLKDLHITHTLCYASKFDEEGEEGGVVRVVGKVYSPGVEKVIAGEPEEVERKTSSAIGELFTELVSKRGWEVFPGELRMVSGRPAVKDGATWKIITARTSHYIQTALDHVRGGSAPGLLYAYEQVMPGTEYSCVVAVSEKSRMCEVLESIKGGAIRYVGVGRGISRGFGRFEVEVKEVEAPEEMRIRNGEIIAFQALTPVFITDPIPRPPRRGDVVMLDGEWYKRVLGDSCRVRLKVICVLGSRCEYRGWSIRTNSPKMPIYALDKGGILICRVEGISETDISYISYLPVLGLDHHASLGFNLVLPLKPDPFAGDRGEEH
jgi:CRISPR/Cas system CSM-associated protein Csm3 (group 7 of RAMP superfamily)